MEGDEEEVESNDDDLEVEPLDVEGDEEEVEPDLTEPDLTADLAASVHDGSMAALTIVRPEVHTTFDRQPGVTRLAEAVPDVVLFDWQQHWQAVKAQLARTDVKWAALQGVRGRLSSRYHGCQFGSGGDWPPTTEPGLQTDCLPLLLTSDGWEHGGEGYAKGEYALAVMPEAMRDGFLARERVLRAELANDAADDDAIVDGYNGITHELFDQCLAWLRTGFDDARLLYSGLDGWLRDSFMPLLLKLAQLLAPAGAVLQLWVTKPPVEMARHAQRAHNFAFASWRSAVVLDTSTRVLYTLSSAYWEPGRCLPAAEQLRGKVLVREWRKDGGMPFLFVAWLRFRKDLPLDLIRLLQQHTLGTDAMCTPGWLYFSDATADNWKGVSDALNPDTQSPFGLRRREQSAEERELWLSCHELQVALHDEQLMRARASLIESYQIERYHE